MESNYLNGLRIVLSLFCLVFGVDKFLEFLPICNLVNDLPKEAIIGLGVTEIVLGMALFSKKYLLISARLATAIMIGGMTMHLLKGTNDFGGALIGTIIGLLLIFTYKKLNK